jgi:hypothetical protein
VKQTLPRSYETLDLDSRIQKKTKPNHLIDAYPPQRTEPNFKQDTQMQLNRRHTRQSRKGRGGVKSRKVEVSPYNGTGDGAPGSRGRGARHQHPVQMREAHAAGHRGEAASQRSTGWRSRRESTARGGPVLGHGGGARGGTGSRTARRNWEQNEATRNDGKASGADGERQAMNLRVASFSRDGCDRIGPNFGEFSNLNLIF